jgi:integrase
MSERIVPTPFMIKLKDTMKEKRDISESTANKYIMDLIILNEKKAFNNLGFLKKGKDRIMEFLSERSDNTEMTYLSAIVSSLSTQQDQHLYKAIYKTYRDILNEKLGKRDEIDPSVKTEAQKENWLSWDEVKAKWNELHEQVQKFKSDRSISRKNFELLVDYLIISLYYLVPPRRNQDYLEMCILLKEVPKDELEPEIKNYLDVINEEFIFNVYKTKKFYGVQVEKIPEELMNVFKIWIKFHPGVMNNKKTREVKLFTNYEGNNTAKPVNFITLRLNKIFGRKVGATMLRHIYITHKFGNEFEEMAKTATAMGHSVSEQRDYSKKD